MVRQVPVPSTFRNRNRITHKSRLKIHHGNLDAEPYIPDEDEEKSRQQHSVAGVDQDDANEHHLQAVLTEAAQQTASGSADKDQAPSAYIPTPDSTGRLSDQQYLALYPADKWKDPHSYIASSKTVEESCVNGLADGFTYFMDERDKAWLDRNNEEARGEGTSALAALASGTRTSSRNAKAKGKEPDVAQPVAISEDELELVMGAFEKVTHDNNLLSHHNFTTVPFPPFADYHGIFATPPHHTLFASLALPSDLPPPSHMVTVAQAIYPHWKQRRTERLGHPIIPILNADESDVLNESYICFRRREVKAVRKTRAVQVSSTDKLHRLAVEMRNPIDIAKALARREHLKREQHKLAEAVFHKRMEFANLKRKNPSLGDRSDEELLIDKERPAKRQDTQSAGRGQLKSERPSAPRAPKPKERLEAMALLTEKALQGVKDRDQNWDDHLDYCYQPFPVSASARLFNRVSYPGDTSAQANPRLIRARIGRGGRRIIDRRCAVRPPVYQVRRSTTSPDDEMDVDEEPIRRLAERWRYDDDDTPRSVPSDQDEQDRVLVDDYDSTYMRHTMTLFTEQDHIRMLQTEPAIVKFDSDGQKEVCYPYQLGMPPIRRPVAATQRYTGPGMISQIALQQAGGVPLSQQMKLSSSAPPVMRISSGSLRSSMTPVVPSMQASPESPATPSRDSSTGVDVQVPKAQPEQPKTMPLVNGFHIPPVNGFSSKAAPFPQANGMNILGNYMPKPGTSPLSVEQVQNLKNVFSSPGTLSAAANLKLPGARQFQWLPAAQFTPKMHPNTVDLNTQTLRSSSINGSSVAFQFGGSPNTYYSPSSAPSHIPSLAEKTG